MFISKLSRAGVRVARQLSRGKFMPSTRTRFLQRLHLQSLQPLFAQKSEAKVFQGAIYQKCHCFSTTSADTEQRPTINVIFVFHDGEEKHIKVATGTSILQAAHENDIELEGACEGSLACSTCHVKVLDMKYYNILDEPVDEENDMLDLAFGLTPTSRLACQLIATPEMDGIRLCIPAATRNFAVDGYVPKPH